MSRKAAILFFSRTAASEAKYKQLLCDQQRNEQLLSAMIAHTKRIARDSGLPSYWISEAQQEGSTFGAKLFNAAKFVFNKGYEQLIIIGNDSPQLRKQDLLQAEKGLALGKAVIGQTKDRGVYLIGLQASQLDERFQELPWQSSDIANSLEDYLTANAVPKSLLLRQSEYVIRLRSIYDLNRGKTRRILQKYLSAFRCWSVFLKSYSSVLVVDFQLIIECLLIFEFKLRGPPVIA